MTLQPVATTKNAVWSWDFVHDVTTDGHALRCLTVKDEHTRWCLAIEVVRSFTHERVIEVLPRLIARYGGPYYMRSANGLEFIAGAWLKFFDDQGITPRRLAPGKPWQNGNNESCKGTFRRECLDAEQLHSLTEARVVIEDWRQQYNHKRPHSALGYQTPAMIYEEASSRQKIEADASSPAGKILAHRLARQATISRPHNGEVGEQSAIVTTTEASIT